MIASSFSNMAFKLASLLFFLLFFNQCSTSKSWLKIGYYDSQTELPVSDINSALFTHLIFGFVSVNVSSYQLYINASSSEKFSTFTNLVKLKTPSVKTIMSIWVGENQDSNFLSALTKSSSRKSFIESSIRTARLNGFDGLDLYSVPPSSSLEMTILRTLLGEWRAAIDSESRKKNQSKLLLVMVSHIMPSLNSVSYPIDAMKKNLDWVHVKSYDYYMPTTSKFSNPHAALYDPFNQVINTNSGIHEWLNRGFPASKLVLGLPYIGYAWTLANPNDYSIGAPSTGPGITLDGSMFYNFLKWYIGSNGYGVKSFYNDTYAVNFCKLRENFISFDDVEAIKAKVSYAKKMNLMGYFVFHVGNDNNWVLSKAALEGDGDQQGLKHRLLTIFLVTTAMIILLLATILCLLQRRALNSTACLAVGIMNIIKRSIYKLKIRLATDHRGSDASNLQVLSYSTVKAATDNFSNQNKLGEGGYGPVYKGTLRTGQEIAVKRLSKTSNQGFEEFENEVKLTANLQHVNLVRVLGYCIERDEKMLIYEYMSNNSLDHYLFDQTKRHLLDWKKRVCIIEGITQGLLYLQEYSNFPIIHRDVKASNILLDNQMNPKISDFGLARMFRKDEFEAITGRIVGTYGYVPPEYIRKGIYSMKYDVYSFGVLLLQIISGKRNTSDYGLNENLHLLEYAYELWKEGLGAQIVDQTLDDSSSTCKIERCMQIALLCVQESPVDRPSMLEVLSMLKNEAAAIISPKKPAFSINESGELNKECCLCRARGELYSIDDATISLLQPR
ncbi:probable LRR receptor-like serine/threonine-protein kinase At3g47570 isoform X3 [Cannabis sativa]|uniref:probable LRR receptor-like serine/threonine-protein kinase At3g47570 isoform X3 n=1 Tax=Cannabis sativa TaxID=3483 RepID=UPI0011E039E3|nr:probable LRR receptor-like serine/threonine-protein kinase At3g47570 isoform X3 [Cannabis sativa]